MKVVEVTKQLPVEESSRQKEYFLKGSQNKSVSWVFRNIMEAPMAEIDLASWRLVDEMKER